MKMNERDQTINVRKRLLKKDLKGKRGHRFADKVGKIRLNKNRGTTPNLMG